MYPYGYDDNYYRQQDKLLRDIEKAINGEYSAIQCYEKIARLAPDKKAREQIKEIRQDEMRHYQEFIRIYTSLTGRQPQVKVTEKCPDTYREGLESAFIDEQETTDFYHEIAKEAPSREIRQTFQNAAADEQNHAVWFLYFLTVGKRPEAL